MKAIGILLLAIHTGATQPQAALEVSNRGLDAYDRGDYRAAELLDRDAVEKWLALGSAYAPHLGITRMNLGQVLAMEGRRPEALAELAQSVELLRGAFGVKDEHTLIGMNLLAGLQLMLGDSAGARKVLEEAVPVAREIDPHGIQLARALDGLACLRLREHRLDEALPIADEALRLAIESAGEDSVDAALTYATAAEVHRVAGRPDRALPLYRRARAIYEKIRGPQDTRVAAVLSQEALILIDERKFALAEQELNRALAIVERSCPDCRLERWNAESALGLLRTRQGKYSEADRLFTSVLAMQESAQPQPSEDLAGTLNALAFVRRKEKRFDDAERLSHRAAAMSFR
jgi:tetratricopeptide (TPR) repeat protein